MTHFIIPTKEYLKMQKKFLPHAVFKNIIHPTFSLEKTFFTKKR
jgi:hypothetical protein